ncbi:MAG TPA: glycosyltransferase family A protein, partial [Saprospiraceae bacterium]|nr:glycosyltransferase family A protein [Saprospiraceae bacterium]
IIPVFNASQFIEEAVNSALLQTQTAEIILVDDGSSDGSFEICESLSSKHEKVHFFFHPNRENKGPSASRNLGMENVRYDYFSFLDADDYYLPGRFDCAERVLSKNSNIDGVYGKIKNLFWDESQKEKYSDTIEIDENFNGGNLFLFLIKDKYPCFGFTSLVLRRKIIDNQIRFDKSFIYAEDIDFIYQITNDYLLIPDGSHDPSGIRRIHGNNMTMNVDYTSQHWRQKLLEKWFRKALNEKMESRCVRALLYRKICQSVYDFNISPNSWLRFPIKILATVYYIFSYPILILKII